MWHIEKNSKWIQWIADKLFDNKRYFVFCPWCGRIGHLVLETHLAACVAKRDRKKLVLIPSYKAINVEIYDCNFTCEVCKNKDIRVWLLHYILIISRICSFFYRRFRVQAVNYMPFLVRALPNIHLDSRIGIEKGRWRTYRVKGTADYQDFDLLMSENIKATLNSDQIRRGESIRKKMGLPDDLWFVCIHVREQGYLGFYPHHNHRDSNILNYIPAIEYIINQGGYVVRMGDSTMTPLPKMKGVIDYANSEYRSGLMDLYFASRCKFFLGCDSGPANYAKLFDRPLCAVNFTDFNLSFYRKNDVKVPKHLFSKEHGRILSFKEVIESDIYIEEMPYNNYIFIENTPEEILNTVVEFLTLIENQNVDDWNLPLQEEIRSIIREKYLSYIENCKIDDGKKDYKAGRVNGKGMIGKYYIERCWEYGQYLEECTLKFKEKSELER